MKLGDFYIACDACKSDSDITLVNYFNSEVCGLRLKCNCGATETIWEEEQPP